MTQQELDHTDCSQAGRFIRPSCPLFRGENMQTSKCDKKGRLLLRPALRRRYGDEFFVVKAPKEVILLPVPSDPVKDLREWGKPLQHLSIEEIKRFIDKQAMEEVGG